jgi:hypothetical protein
MTSGLIERNKQRTRRELAEAAARLFLERGYPSTTVQDIVDAADVSPRTCPAMMSTRACGPFSMPCSRPPWRR